jgi:hypothetical protein
MTPRVQGVKAGAVGNGSIVFHGATAEPLGLYPCDTMRDSRANPSTAAGGLRSFAAPAAHVVAGCFCRCSLAGFATALSGGDAAEPVATLAPHPAPLRPWGRPWVTRWPGRSGRSERPGAAPEPCLCLGTAGFSLGAARVADAEPIPCTRARRARLARTEDSWGSRAGKASGSDAGPLGRAWVKLERCAFLLWDCLCPEFQRDVRSDRRESGPPQKQGPSSIRTPPMAESAMNGAPGCQMPRSMALRLMSLR